MKKLRQQADRRAVKELRKVLHRYRTQGEARLRVLSTIAAEGISRRLGSAMRRELRPDPVLLSATRRRLRRMGKMKKCGGTKSRSS